jgi:hypothetical protein
MGHLREFVVTAQADVKAEGEREVHAKKASGRGDGPGRGRARGDPRRELNPVHAVRGVSWFEHG